MSRREKHLPIDEEHYLAQVAQPSANVGIGPNPPPQPPGARPANDRAAIDRRAREAAAAPDDDRLLDRLRSWLKTASLDEGKDPGPESTVYGLRTKMSRRLPIYEGIEPPELKNTPPRFLKARLALDGLVKVVRYGPTATELVGRITEGHLPGVDVREGAPVKFPASIPPLTEENIGGTVTVPASELVEYLRWSEQSRASQADADPSVPPAEIPPGV